MTSSDSSSSVRVISSSGSRETSRYDPEVGSSGASSGPPSRVDARVLRDLEVMKSDHDLDTAVTEGSLAVIRERYNIPIKYGLHVPQPGQRPYSLDAPGMCIRFPLQPLIEECLRWWRISPSQVAPNSWHYLVVFLSECRGTEIILTRDLFMACFRLCKSRGGYYLTARVGFRVSGAPSNNKGWKSRYLLVSGPVWGFRLDWSAHPIDNASHQMDLRELREMPKVTSGKVPPTRPTAREVGASPAREAPKASLKRPVVTPTEQAEDAARHHKKVKVLTRRHKSRLGKGESHSRSKGKEPAAPSEEPEAPAESEEGGASPAHQRPRLMKGVFKTKVHKGDAGYYTLLMSDLGHQDPEKEMKARWKRLKNSTKELEKTKRERSEELLRRKASEKELHEVRSHLGDAQRLLKEARVRARKMDDELLQAVKALESARAELPRQSVVQYKESLGFKEGLKRMGW
ncbi:hypothetical protein BHM03_00059905 [Ensete ventricosum]|nr:hypothetical protein BHM03_00059905 [Ensete ventricosum]